ncbi:MAG: OmpA family protein [Bacteroidales bacterium]|nr:OmpA family protein [Bacteroidales bacterium]
MKKIVKRYISILLLLCIFFGVNSNLHAEGKIDSLLNTFNNKRADKAYENLAYAKAIDIYVNLIDKDFNQKNIYSKLAYSYLKIGEWENSVKNYNNLISLSEYKAEDLYNYAQALKSIGNYSESDIRMKQYATLNSEDSRIKRQANTNDEIKKIKSVIRYKIEPVSFNSKYSDFGAIVKDDKIYFTSERRIDAVVNYEYAWKEAPYLDIYELKMNGLISKPEFLKEKVNSKYHDGPACFSKDGKEMFFTRNNSLFRFISKKGEDNTNNLRILYINDVNGIFSTPEEMPFNSDNYSCGHPSISANDSILYFTSDMPGGYGGADIYLSERTDSAWTAPRNLGPEINTEGNEMFPYIHESGVLYFASNGHLGLGGLDIYQAIPDNEKYKIENMGYPLNSKYDDFSLTMNEEQKEGYFASNREGGQGDDDIYKFEKLDVSITLQVRTFDKLSKQRITNPKIYFNEVVIINANEHSENQDFDYSVKVKSEEKHALMVKKPGYRPFNASFNIAELEKQNNTIVYNVYLEKEAEWGIFGKVFYKETMEEIPNVNIHIEDGTSSFVKSYLSDSNGVFRIKLKKERDYKLRFEKDDIFAIRAEYSTVGRDSGWVNINEFVELVFEKIELNKKIEIPNIYYDVAKWNIREDAAVELDNVVQFLLDNSRIKIELGSHTDARGSSKSNQSLSQKRAQSAVDYIVGKGIESERITARGYGEEQIKNRCVDGVSCSKAEHQENRRTEIRITGI